jgi:hypothetical protein
MLVNFHWVRPVVFIIQKSLLEPVATQQQDGKLK